MESNTTQNQEEGSDEDSDLDDNPYFKHIRDQQKGLSRTQNITNFVRDSTQSLMFNTPRQNT